MAFSKEAQRQIEESARQISANLVTEAAVLDCCAAVGLKRFLVDSTAVYYAGTKARAREAYKRVLLSRQKEITAFYSCSMLIATLNTNQKIAASVLLELGYVCTGWAKRRAGTGFPTRVAVFVKQLYGTTEEML